MQCERISGGMCTQQRRQERKQGQLIMLEVLEGYTKPNNDKLARQKTYVTVKTISSFISVD